MANCNLLVLVSVATQVINNKGYQKATSGSPTKYDVMQILQSNAGKSLKDICTQDEIDRAKEAIKWICTYQPTDDFLKKLKDAVVYCRTNGNQVDDYRFSIICYLPQAYTRELTKPTQPQKPQIVFYELDVIQAAIEEITQNGFQAKDSATPTRDAVIDKIKNGYQANDVTTATDAVDYVANSRFSENSFKNSMIELAQQIKLIITSGNQDKGLQLEERDLKPKEVSLYCGIANDYLTYIQKLNEPKQKAERIRFTPIEIYAEYTESKEDPRGDSRNKDLSKRYSIYKVEQDYYTYYFTDSDDNKYKWYTSIFPGAYNSRSPIVQRDPNDEEKWNFIKLPDEVVGSIKYRESGGMPMLQLVKFIVDGKSVTVRDFIEEVV